MHSRTSSQHGNAFCCQQRRAGQAHSGTALQVTGISRAHLQLVGLVAVVPGGVHADDEPGRAAAVHRRQIPLQPLHLWRDHRAASLRGGFLIRNRCTVAMQTSSSSTGDAVGRSGEQPLEVDQAQAAAS